MIGTFDRTDAGYIIRMVLCSPFRSGFLGLLLLSLSRREKSRRISGSQMIFSFFPTLFYAFF